MRILEKAKKYWDQIAQFRKDEIEGTADEYRSLVNDVRYIRTMRPLLEKKRLQKEQEISTIAGNTVEEVGMKFIALRAERNVYDNLIKAPENFFKELKKIKEQEREVKNFAHEQTEEERQKETV